LEVRQVNPQVEQVIYDALVIDRHALMVMVIAARHVTGGYVDVSFTELVEERLAHRPSEGPAICDIIRQAVVADDSKLLIFLYNGWLKFQHSSSSSVLIRADAHIIQESWSGDFVGNLSMKS
jgi:hypothetical protein